MKIVLYSDNVDEYLKKDGIVDYGSKAIRELADALSAQAGSEIGFIKAAYEFVRDNIPHSADIGEESIPCTASEVLKAGHGVCFAKSHLLAAILRCKSVPSGFCYQKLILQEETEQALAYHGLNGVYIKDYKKWIRIDTGVEAQFSIEEEQLVIPVRLEMGEADGFVVYPDPDAEILEKLRKNKTRTELWDNLPTELGYGNSSKCCMGINN